MTWNKCFSCGKNVYEENYICDPCIHHMCDLEWAEVVRRAKSKEKGKMANYKITLNVQVENQFDEHELVEFLQNKLHLDVDGVIATVDASSLKKNKRAKK